MQAARGASLKPSDPTPRPTAVHWSLFGGVAVAAYLLDQVTKAWAVAALADGPIDVWGEWFQLRLVFNPGAAFSTGTQYTIVFTVISAVAVVAVLWFSRRVRSRVWAVGLGVLLAGVAGNLTDRLFRDPEPFRGHVVDFLSFGTFPVFNVADICINVAAGVIILQSVRGIGLDGVRDTDRKTAGDPDELPGAEEVG